MAALAPDDVPRVVPETDTAMVAVAAAVTLAVAAVYMALSSIRPRPLHVAADNVLVDTSAHFTPEDVR